MFGECNLRVHSCAQGSQLQQNNVNVYNKTFRLKSLVEAKLEDNINVIN